VKEVCKNVYFGNFQKKRQLERYRLEGKDYSKVDLK
jgi:hypothetical protein